jgi:hypothetical protein
MNGYETSDAPRRRVARHIYEHPLRQPGPEQFALDFNPPQPAPTELSIGERFAAFHQANPQVFRQLHALAIAQAAAGVRRISVNGLYGVVRAAGPATTSTGGAYRLDNSFTRCYADLLAEDPRLTDLIERRTRHAE